MPPRRPAPKQPTRVCRVPRGPFPPGGHWYYRVDRATKRNCWYIGEEKNKSARAAPKDSSSSPAASAPEASPPVSPVAAAPVSPQQTINVRKSIADARAELTAPQARVEDLSEPQTTGAVPVASIANGQRAAAPDAAAPSSPITSRWPGIIRRQPIERSAPCRRRAAAELKARKLKACRPAQHRRRSPPSPRSRWRPRIQRRIDSRHRCRCCC